MTALKFLPDAGPLGRLLDRLFSRSTIGRRGSPLLHRWFLPDRIGPFRPKTWRYRPMLHCFLRSDPEDFHSHPWAFVTFILWGGYYERTLNGRQWRGPLTFLFRPATWTHRVELPPGRTSWSLVVAAPKVRGWGFLCGGSRWVHWREYDAREESGLVGCGDVP